MDAVDVVLFLSCTKNPNMTTKVNRCLTRFDEREFLKFHHMKNGRYFDCSNLDAYEILLDKGILNLIMKEFHLKSALFGGYALT